jgi:hypothetical protein
VARASLVREASLFFTHRTEPRGLDPLPVRVPLPGPLAAPPLPSPTYL